MHAWICDEMHAFVTALPSDTYVCMYAHTHTHTHTHTQTGPPQTLAHSWRQLPGMCVSIVCPLVCTCTLRVSVSRSARQRAHTGSCGVVGIFDAYTHTHTHTHTQSAEMRVSDATTEVLALLRLPCRCLYSIDEVSVCLSRPVSL